MLLRQALANRPPPQPKNPSTNNSPEGSDNEDDKDGDGDLEAPLGPDAAAFDHLAAFIEGQAGASGIVYAHTREQVDVAARALAGRGADVAAYHAGKDAATRARILRDWKDGGLQGAMPFRLAPRSLHSFFARSYETVQGNDLAPGPRTSTI